MELETPRGCHKSGRMIYQMNEGEESLNWALRKVSKKWSSVRSWREALNRFPILWPEGCLN